MRNKIIVLALCGTAVLVPSIAFAQTAADDSAVGIADIVVTAQRKAENLQNVPVAVTAISSEQLDQMRVTNVRNLASLAPNLQITNQGIQSIPQITIRGIASGASNNGVDPKVGLYLDGVYIGRSVGAIFDLADIERVEVLRGPQGTLFGRNATGGALSLVTSPPTGELGVKASVSYGNYDAKRGKIVLNLPSFGPLSIKLAYLHDEIDGDANNLIGGRTIDLRLRDPKFGVLKYADKLGGRNIDGGQIAVRLQAADNLTVDYRFDYSDARTVGRAVQGLGIIPNGGLFPLVGGVVAFQPLTGGITNLSGSRLDDVANATSVEHVVTQGHSLIASWEQSDTVTVKSITAFRKFRQDPNIYDLAASGGLRFSGAQFGALLAGDIPGIISAPAPDPNNTFFSLLTARSTKQKQFSEELQLLLSTKSLDWTSGVFFFHENSPATDILGIAETVDNGVVTPSPLDALFGSGVTRTTAINDSLAWYSQLTYHVTDQLDVTGGLRYTFDDRKTKIFGISGGQGGQLGVGTYKTHFRKLNYTGIITYRPTSDITSYAKISTGYVAGGLLNAIRYNPENLTSYELGLKTKLLDNHLRTNVALFYSKYKDLQIQNFANGVQSFLNAGKANIKGVELEVELVPVSGLTISGNFGYTDFDYKQYFVNGIDIAAVARTPYFSKITASGSIQYDGPDFSNGSHLYARADATYKSKAPLVSPPITDDFGVVSPPEDRAFTKGFALVNGRVGLSNLSIGGAKTSLSVFGQNLFNKDYNPFGAPVFYLSTTYERGRTYGVELGVEF